MARINFDNKERTKLANFQKAMAGHFRIEKTNEVMKFLIFNLEFEKLVHITDMTWKIGLRLCVRCRLGH